MHQHQDKQQQQSSKQQQQPSRQTRVFRRCNSFV